MALLGTPIKARPLVGVNLLHHRVLPLAITDLQQSMKQKGAALQTCLAEKVERVVETLPHTVLFSIPLQYVTLSFRNCRTRRVHVPDYAYMLQGLFVFPFLDLLLGDKEI